ncbi:glycoside hydrolase family 71/99-like protein [Algibacter sp. PT7-4]|uniref:glycoside hydrolase family 71/99-like protein n=1 Tax=Algibacter ulvanivorans TaxID=3400999 RepID=UPI003AAD3548
MFYFLKKRQYAYYFICAIFLCISCENNIELTDSSINKSYKIPEYTHVYNDSILQQILNEELNFINNKPKGFTAKANQGMTINKSNPKKVYVHYMPWFQSKPYDGYWGQHWTMTNKNPDIIDENGQNEIASYYNPLIGPYSSSDPDLQEYHFLLMKLAGIDGVIFDWYGSRNIHDYGLIKNATETFIPKLANIDLDFSIMYEDRVAFMETNNTNNNPVLRAQEDFNYIKNVYFESSNYLEFNGSKFISIFGPHHLTNENDWNTIYNVFTEEQPTLISLWGLSNNLGNLFSGEFLWVAPDHLAAQDYYYATYANGNSITIGSTYPGFKSFYTEGGWGNGANEWVLPNNDGLTFIESLNNSSFESADFIQIVTWNDFGEGTIIEPTTQFGFTYLTMLQEYTGSAHSEDDLITATRLYQLRKEYANNATIQQLLDNSYVYMKQLKIKRVNQILQAIERFNNAI